MTTATWTDPAYEGVAELLCARTGLTFTPNRLRDAEVGIGRAMTRAGITEVARYLHLLQTERVPLDDLIVELTVGETYFFREPAQFEFIRQEVVPEIQHHGAPDRLIRVWSAGCASGEEAYSLAILFEEEGLAERASILATDISRTALAKARAGAYGRWSLRGDQHALAERYFRRRGDQLVLGERFRGRVAFEHLNLALDTYPSFATGAWGMDLILCRNVLIYFNRETIRRVACRLLECLAGGGWLITGPSDPALSDDAPYETVVTPAGVFYRHRARTQSSPFAPRSVIRGSPAQTAAPPPVHVTSSQELVLSSVVKEPGLEGAPGTEPDSLAEARDAFAKGEYARVVESTSGLSADPAACALRVRALANLGDLSGAETTAMKAVADHPLATELHFLRAVLLVSLGRDDEAAKASRRATYLDRSLAIAHFTLGSILRRLGDLVGARRAYRNAYDLAVSRRAEEVVPLTDGESAGRLAEAAKAQMALLETIPEASL